MKQNMSSETKEQTIKIGNVEIGSKHPPRIIAEIGINHSGDINTAKKLADLAASNGADIIKSQFHIPNEEMSPAAKKVIPPHTSKSIFEIMEDCSLTADEEYEFTMKDYLDLQKLGLKELKNPLNHLCLIKMSDEVLDHNKTLAYFSKSYVLSEKGGNHSYDDFFEKIPLILDYLY